MAYSKNTLARLINTKFKTKWDSSHANPLENSGRAYEDRMILFESIAEAVLDHLNAHAANSMEIKRSDGTNASNYIDIILNP